MCSGTDIQHPREWQCCGVHVPQAIHRGGLRREVERADTFRREHRSVWISSSECLQCVCDALEWSWHTGTVQVLLRRLAQVVRSRLQRNGTELLILVSDGGAILPTLGSSRMTWPSTSCEVVGHAQQQMREALTTKRKCCEVIPDGRGAAPRKDGRRIWGTRASLKTEKERWHQLEQRWCCPSVRPSCDLKNDVGLKSMSLCNVKTCARPHYWLGTSVPLSQLYI